MGRKIRELLFDDMSGEELVDGETLEKVFIGIEGDIFQLELSPKSLKAFKASTKKYVDKAEELNNGDDSTVYVFTDAFDEDGWKKPVPTTHQMATAARKSTAAKNSPEHLDRIRQWARANGREVADRGRIAADLKLAYNEANPSDTIAI